MTELNDTDKAAISSNGVLNEVPERGDRVEWTYKHWLNSKSFVHITKEGIFIDRVKHKKRYLAEWNIHPKARVKFDDNKNTSTVPLGELKVIYRGKNFWCNNEKNEGKEKCSVRCAWCRQAVRR